MTFAYVWSQITAIGPVLVEFTPAHGIHAGDLVGFLPFTLTILFGVMP